MTKFRILLFILQTKLSNLIQFYSVFELKCSTLPYEKQIPILDTEGPSFKNSKRQLRKLIKEATRGIGAAHSPF